MEKKKVKGIPACVGGTVVGRVRIVFNPALEKIKVGDVLVARMTTPVFVSLMRNAVAIVTDGGSLLSHAAIVARELRKPCVVGTRIATKIFKNGDMVEVNTKSGVVRTIMK
jgi:pyruvate,water dikinase